MHLDRDHPSNRGVLEYFGRDKPGHPPLFEPVSDPAALRHTGAHPDIVDHLWDLATALPVEWRERKWCRAALEFAEA